MNVPVEVSNKHVHLSRKDLDALFGKDYKLHVEKQLSQPTDFAAKETVIIINKDRKFDNIRILGPERKSTQVELAQTDAVNLKLKVPVKLSGDIKGSPGITIKGPKGTIKIKNGVFIPHRHLHASEKDAKKLGIKDKQLVSIRIPGDSEVIFKKVLVRINPTFRLAVHINTDEGNAAGIDKETLGELIL